MLMKRLGYWAETNSLCLLGYYGEAGEMGRHHLYVYWAVAERLGYIYEVILNVPGADLKC